MKWDLYIALIAEDVERFFHIFIAHLHLRMLISIVYLLTVHFLFTFSSSFGIPDNIAILLLIFLAKRKIITLLQRHLNPHAFHRIIHNS